MLSVLVREREVTKMIGRIHVTTLESYKAILLKDSASAINNQHFKTGHYMSIGHLMEHPSKI